MTTAAVEAVKIGRRSLTKGDVLTFSHVSGDFTFVKAYVNEDGSARTLLVCGGKRGRRHMRMFDPAKISKKYKTATLEAKGKR